MNREGMGPLKYSWNHFTTGIKGIGHLFKHPIMLLPIILVSLAWYVLSGLKVIFPDAALISFLSFLTFAQGGMYGGFFSALGGIIGKTLIAGIITLLFSRMISKDPKKNANKPKSLWSQAIRINSIKAFELLFLGMGLAFILYQFMTGFGGLENAMVGIMSMMMAIRSLNHPDSFLIGLVRSFSKGRLPKERAAHWILGLFVGFLMGVLLSFIGLGALSYAIGLVILLLGVFFWIISLLGKKSVAMLIFVFLMVQGLPFFPVKAESSWQDPFDAYDISLNEAYDYMELSNAMELSPPAAMELTVVAAGYKNFDQSIALDPIELVLDNGVSERIQLTEIQFNDAIYGGYVTCYLDVDGWYAETEMGYQVRDSWTNNEWVAGLENAYSKIYTHPAAIIGAPAYLYENYVEAGYMYVSIPIEFSYGDMASMGEVSGGASLFARVDAVKLESSPQAEAAYGGQWVRIKDETFILSSQNSEYQEKIPVDGTRDLSSGSFINVTEFYGNGIMTQYGDETSLMYDYYVDYSQDLPERLKAEEQLNIPFSGEFYLDGNALDQMEPNSRMVFIAHRLGEQADQELMSESGFVGASYSPNMASIVVPQGSVEGERMTVVRGLGNFEGVAFMATVYEWKYVQIIPEDEEPEGEITQDTGEEDPWEDPWAQDWEDDWSDYEHATGAELVAINVASTAGAFIGAGIAVAGGFGKWGDYDPTDGTLVVTAPNGSQEIYRQNPNTGEFESSFGSVLNVQDVDRAHSEQQAAMEWTRQQTKAMEKGEDGDSQYWNQVNRIEHLRRTFEEKGLGRPDSIETKLANRLGKMQKDIHAGKGIDAKDYERISRVIGRHSRNEIGDASDLPKDYTTSQNYRDMLKLSSEEIARGESGKAIAVRVLAGILSGGKSEFGFEAARSVYIVKDYVDEGGDSWNEAVSRAAMATIIDEGIGRGVGSALGLGAKALGKGASVTKNIASKTQIGKAAVEYAESFAKRSKDFFGQDIVKASKNIFSTSAKQADDAAKAFKGRQASKLTSESMEKMSKEGVYQQEAKRFKNISDSVKKDADEAVEQFLSKNKELTKRDELFRKGEKIGQAKVNQLKSAQEALESNPASKEAQEAFDESMRKVQQDKFAMNKLNQDPSGESVRKMFNQRNSQYNKAAVDNTIERIAAERDIDPSKIKVVQATNKAATEGVADASRTARELDYTQQTVADFPGGHQVDDMVAENIGGAKSPFDKDVTYRIYDDVNKEWIDLPKSDVERIYQQELYKAHHNGKIPRTDINGRDVLDEAKIKQFAEDMDHTVTDRTSPDAYGRGDSDLRKITDNDSMDLRDYEDISSISNTMEYKSNEWFERGQKLRDEAKNLPDDLAEDLLIKAEGMDAEGIRQLTKQFDNQSSSQIKAAMAAGHDIHVPEKTFKAIKVLENVKDGKITVSQAERILGDLGTDIDKTVKQHSAIMEAIDKIGK